MERTLTERTCNHCGNVRTEADEFRAGRLRPPFAGWVRVTVTPDYVGASGELELDFCRRSCLLAWAEHGEKARKKKGAPDPTPAQLAQDWHD